MTLTKKQRREVYLYAYREIERVDYQNGACNLFAENIGKGIMFFEAAALMDEYLLFRPYEETNLEACSKWFLEPNERLTALAFCIAMTED